MRLTPAEGMALVAAADVLIDRYSHGPDRGPLERAIQKLASLLGIEPGDVIDIDFDPGGGPEGALLREAIEADRQVSFTYWTYGREPGGGSPRRPLGGLHRGRDLVPVGVGARRGGHPKLPPRPHGRRGGDGPAPGAGPRSARPGSARGRPCAARRPRPCAVSPVGRRGPPGGVGRTDGRGSAAGSLVVAGASWLERLLVRRPDATVVEISSELGDADIAAGAARRVRPGMACTKRRPSGALGSTAVSIEPPPRPWRPTGPSSTPMAWPAGRHAKPEPNPPRQGSHKPATRSSGSRYLSVRWSSPWWCAPSCPDLLDPVAVDDHHVGGR